MGYKSPGVLLEVVVIKREVKALALNCACGKRVTFSHSFLGQDATIYIRPRFWGDYPCDKIPGCVLEVVVIKREVKALARNCARGKRRTLSHSLLGQDATI